MAQVDFDITVVGAGLVGLAFACSMKDSGFRILVIDSGSSPKFDEKKFDLRVNSIHLASQKFLNKLNVWSIVASQRVCPFSKIQVWSSTGGFIEFSAREIEEKRLGYIVEQNALNFSLVERIRKISNIELRFSSKLEFISEQSDRVQLNLDSGEKISCSLLVGADGANSVVRELSKIPRSTHSYQQKAIVAQVEASEPTHGIAYQKFLSSGPLAFLPLVDGSFSIVWSCTKQQAIEYEALDDSMFAMKLSKAFDYRLGDFRLLSSRVSFDLQKLWARNYFKGRVVLVGDSAHVIHPLAGMGANLGLMDAAALSEILSAGGERNIFSQQSLRKYERWRKSANLPVMTMMDALNNGFGSSSGVLREFLGSGLTLTNQIPNVKGMLIRLACGISGDLPEIVRHNK